MVLALAIFGVASAAFSVWLGVRILNRRERWAKWTLAGVVGLPVCYVVSFGPACWISSRLQPSGEIVSTVYSPIIPALLQGPLTVQSVLTCYVAFGTRGGCFSVDGALRIEFLGS